MKANRASSTSLVVVESLVLTGSNPATREWVDPDALDFARKVLEFHGRKSEPGKWHCLTRKVAENATIPGMCLHHAIRKRVVEEFVRRQIAAGARQVVTLGAGFDSLAYRLHREFPEVDFLEIDHPATRESKLRFLESLDSPPESNLAFTAADLAQPFDPGEEFPSKGTVAVIEGVLMYLPREAALTMLKKLAPLDAVIFTFMINRAGFCSQTWIANLWMAKKGEPFLWGMPVKEMKQFLQEAGFESPHIASTGEPNSGPLQIAQGEKIAMAEGEVISDY